MKTPIYQVDSFTNKPFTGNPAAVAILESAADPVWMQSVAREMNLSETAYVRPLHGDAEADFELRWFTPAVEVDLCGHATLASAHVLWELGSVPQTDPIRFRTLRSGVLTCAFNDDWITMDFPKDVKLVVDGQPDKLYAALGFDQTEAVTAIADVWRSREDWIVVLADAAAIHDIKPDFTALGAFKRGVAVTAQDRSESGNDFICRFFAPAFGIDEDPVTGSLQCALGPYWANVLKKETLRGRQVSPRGGDFQITIRGDRVLLSGHAVTTLRGELLR